MLASKCRSRFHRDRYWRLQCTVACYYKDKTRNPLIPYPGCNAPALLKANSTSHAPAGQWRAEASLYEDNGTTPRSHPEPASMLALVAVLKERVLACVGRLVPEHALATPFPSALPVLKQAAIGVSYSLPYPWKTQSPARTSRSALTRTREREFRWWPRWWLWRQWRL